MSGGSFNYFYSECPANPRRYAADLSRMADACQERAAGAEETHWKTGKVVDLAALAEAGDFLRMLSFKIAGIARVLESIEGVTRGVEWWKSGDDGIDNIVEQWRRTTQATKGTE